MQKRGELWRWRVVAGLVLLATLLPVPCVAEDAAQGTGATLSRVELKRGENPGLLGLRVEDAPLAEVTAVLEQELRCQVELPGKLPQHRLTAELSSRPPERLFPALARRINCRLVVEFRLGHPPAAAPYGTHGSLFAEGQAPVPLPRSLEGEAALSLLLEAGVKIATDPTVTPQGMVRFPRNGLPLRVTLDAVARGTGLAWWPVARLEPRKSVDAAAEEDDRRQTFYSDLVALTPEERREEITADLDRLAGLSPDARKPAVARMAGDLAGLGTLFERTPGEHRDGIGARLLAIGRDYWGVLSAFPPERRDGLAPLLDALRGLGARLVGGHYEYEG